MQSDIASYETYHFWAVQHTLYNSTTTVYTQILCHVFIQRAHLPCDPFSKKIKWHYRKEILQSKDKCMFLQERKVRHILRPEEKLTCWFGGGDQDFMRTTFSSTTNPACGFYIPSSITCSPSSLQLFPIWQPVSTVTSVISLICLFLIIHTHSCSKKIDDITLFICTIIWAVTAIWHVFFSLAIMNTDYILILKSS